jgi:hypothetical protein
VLLLDWLLEEPDELLDWLPLEELLVEELELLETLLEEDELLDMLEEDDELGMLTNIHSG